MAQLKQIRLLMVCGDIEDFRKHTLKKYHRLLFFAVVQFSKYASVV